MASVSPSSPRPTTGEWHWGGCATPPSSSGGTRGDPRAPPGIARGWVAEGKAAGVESLVLGRVLAPFPAVLSSKKGAVLGWDFLIGLKTGLRMLGPQITDVGTPDYGC